MIEVYMFRFDAKKDILRYYKPYEFKDIYFTTLKEMFEEIKKQDPYFEFDNTTHVKISNICVNINENIQNIISHFGKSITIEPLSTLRVYKDLKINDDDFMAHFDKFSPFCDKEDFEFYKSLQWLYYASPLRAYKDDYIAESAFVFVNEMIKKYPQKQKEFLKIINNYENGIYHHIDISKYIFNDVLNVENIIHTLKQRLKESSLYLEIKPPHITSSNFIHQNEKECLSTDKKDFKHKLNDFNIAVYSQKKDNIFKFTKMLGAKNINFDMDKFPDISNILSLEPQMAYNIAGDIMLDAIDNGADFMVVNDEISFYLFDTCSKKLQAQTNREFGNFYVLSLKELYEICFGDNIPNSIKTHKLKVWLI